MANDDRILLLALCFGAGVVGWMTMQAVQTRLDTQRMAAELVTRAQAGASTTTTTTLPPGSLTLTKATVLVLNPTCRDIDVPTCVKALVQNDRCYTFHLTYGRCDAQKCYLLESPLLDIEIVGKKFLVRPKDPAVRVVE